MHCSQGLCPRTLRIYRLMPLPMLGLLRIDEKEGCQSIPLYRSVEATESALGLLPSMALSSAQSITDCTAVGERGVCGEL